MRQGGFCVVKHKMSEEHKALHIRMAICKERLAWILGFLIHAWVHFFLFQFVRFYSWEVVKAWAMATLWSVVHRFFSSPAILMVWVLGLLIVFRTCSLLDGFVLDSTASVFPGPLKCLFKAFQRPSKGLSNAIRRPLKAFQRSLKGL